MSRIKRLTRLAAALLAAMLLAPAAEAHRAWPVIGGGGDATVTATCPPGQEVVGFSGRAGLWIDQIQLMCAPINPDGSTGAPHPGSGLLGGSGGGPQTVLCDHHTRLLTVGMTYTANRRQVARIYMACTAIRGNAVTFNDFGGSYAGSDSNHNSCAATATCGPDSADVRQACPNERFTGFTARVGKDVNALGFICDP